MRTERLWPRVLLQARESTCTHGRALGVYPSGLLPNHDHDHDHARGHYHEHDNFEQISFNVPSNRVSCYGQLLGSPKGRTT